eukprot:5808227-Amphidinium_carterae.1
MVMMTQVTKQHHSGEQHIYFHNAIATGTCSHAVGPLFLEGSGMKPNALAFCEACRPSGTRAAAQHTLATSCNEKILNCTTAYSSTQDKCANQVRTRKRMCTINPWQREAQSERKIDCNVGSL